jgi:hypothetical protein
MKSVLFVLAFFYCYGAIAQSPGLIIHFDVDSIKADGLNFKIEMKFCEPLKRTQSKSYFTNDSSTIDFKKLDAKDISCESYISNYNSNAYHYYFSNQVFAWEKIIIWKLSAASGDWKEPMYVILPVKIKSFVTFITVKDVAFEPGKFIWIDEEGKVESNSGRNFLFSLKNRKGLDTDKCSLKKILD